MDIYMKIKLTVVLLYFLQTLTYIQGEYTYIYKGCHVYNAGAYSTYTTSSDNSIEYCVSYCGQDSYIYAAVSHINCYCGTSTSRYNQSSRSANCNYPCPGNQRQTCGGSVDVSVYEIADVSTTSATTPTTTTTAAPTTTTPIATTTATTKTTTPTMPTTTKTTTTTTTTTATTDITQTDSEKMADTDQKISSNVTKYIGIGVGAVVVCAIIVLVVLLVVHRRFKKKPMKVEEGGTQGVDGTTSTNDTTEYDTIDTSAMYEIINGDHELDTYEMTRQSLANHINQPLGAETTSFSGDLSNARQGKFDEARESDVYEGPDTPDGSDTDSYIDVLPPLPLDDETEF